MCPPSHDDKDIFKYPPSRKSSVEINSYKNDIYKKTKLKPKHLETQAESVKLKLP